jgi:uncharacterized protein (TIGR02246 family)
MADWQNIDLDVSSNQGSNNMGKRILRLSAACAFLLLIPMIQPSLMAAEDQQSLQVASDDVVIRKLGAEYVDAFNKHDANILSEYWSPEAVYTNRLTDEQVIGRAAIAEQFQDLFASAGALKLSVSVDSIDFISPNVALEKGLATFVADKQTPEEVPYSAVYVKRDGKWLLDRVTDDPQPVVPSHYEQLKPLEWMIGTWVDNDDVGAVQAECNWTKNKNFITRSFTVSIEGQIDLSGMQIIGWDAGEKRIRSWTFDSDGGFAEAQWSNQGNEWYVLKKGRTTDGRAVSAVNVMTYLDEDTFTFKSVQRAVDGELLPDIDEVMVVRQ